MTQSPVNGNEPNRITGWKLLSDFVCCTDANGRQMKQKMMIYLSTSYFCSAKKKNGKKNGKKKWKRIKIVLITFTRAIKDS